MTKPLEGKVAIVTGGSRGIGAAIVRRLAMDGASVAFTFANSKEKAEAITAEIELKGGRVLYGGGERRFCRRLKAQGWPSLGFRLE